MEKLGINWKILIGQILNFLILVFVLKKYVYKPFLATLRKREEKIKEGIEKSQQLEKALKEIEEMKNEIRRESEKEAEKIIKQAREKAEKEASEILTQAKEKEREIIETAKNLAKEEFEREKEKREKEMIEFIFLLAEKFLAKKIDRESDQKLIEELISKLK